jgi:hypothetical protein
MILFLGSDLNFLSGYPIMDHDFVDFLGHTPKGQYEIAQLSSSMKLRQLIIVHLGDNRPRSRKVTIA